MFTTASIGTSTANGGNIVVYEMEAALLPQMRNILPGGGRQLSTAIT
jgi:hypothetical protein